jgi:hypothetical protein
MYMPTTNTAVHNLANHPIPASEATAPFGYCGRSETVRNTGSAYSVLSLKHPLVSATNCQLQASWALPVSLGGFGVAIGDRSCSANQPTI